MAGTGKRVLKWIGGLITLFIGLIIAAAVATTFIWPPVNDVTTGRTPGYEDLKPQTFKASPDRVFEAAQEAIEGIPRMRIISTDDAAHTLEAEAKTPRGTFTDDVTLSLQDTSGGTEVIIRSRSRVGQLDFGQNARNIREIQEKMFQLNPR